MKNDDPALLTLVLKRLVLLSSFVILSAAFLSGCGAQEAASRVETADVREFLTHYFSTWSAKDMDGYGACFHEQARVVFVHQGAPHSYGLTDFLHGQKLSHATTTVPMTEVPTDMKILRDDRTAQASVRWKLTKGSEITTGTDCFTLIQTPAGWKIMSLVFYND
ncbi:nuclear transport factor 2 family protein [Prosthecobacter vanneervenii]|uniref:DUF4440 domain-containing protein n=1 Tax=Prosthecobacter vanneervenii TaxID=48466 RepID=A0A7W8DN47_9BACT|nr:nuclear transport factor 2 family protein [Prosthecobacter vanneervenii]MBB5035511.1 hypothetical protein [Prosthecobacter vanneervenii]